MKSRRGHARWPTTQPPRCFSPASPPAKQGPPAVRCCGRAAAPISTRPAWSRPGWLQPTSSTHSQETTRRCSPSSRTRFATARRRRSSRRRAGCPWWRPDVFSSSPPTPTCRSCCCDAGGSASRIRLASPRRRGRGGGLPARRLRASTLPVSVGRAGWSSWRVNAVVTHSP